MFMFSLHVGVGSAGPFIHARPPIRALVLFDYQRHLRARGHTVPNHRFVLRPHLVLLQDRIARGVDWEQVWIDGETLRMADASGFFETNLHKVSFFDGFWEHRDVTNRWVD
jgi:hypothetical protein